MKMLSEIIILSSENYVVEEAWGAEETEAVCFYKLVKDAARHAFNKPRGKGKRQDCDARLRGQDCDARLRGVLNEKKTAVMNHDDLATKILTRDLKKLASTNQVR